MYHITMYTAVCIVCIRINTVSYTSIKSLSLTLLLSQLIYNFEQLFCARIVCINRQHCITISFELYNILSPDFESSSGSSSAFLFYDIYIYILALLIFVIQLSTVTITHITSLPLCCDVPERKRNCIRKNSGTTCSNCTFVSVTCRYAYLAYQYIPNLQLLSCLLKTKGNLMTRGISVIISCRHQSILRPCILQLVR